MNTLNPRIGYIIYILPVIAIVVILRQHLAQDGPRERARTSSAFLHSPILSNGPPIGKAIYKYAVNGGPTPPAAFSADAPHLADGSMGDSATGYLASSDGVPGNSKDLCVLIDLGTKAPLVREWEFAGEFRGSTENSVTLSANDSPFSGAWTSIDRVDNAPTGRVSKTRRISPARHRYWLIRYESSGSGASIMAFDTRLVDNSGRIIRPFGVGSAAVRPAISRYEAGQAYAPLRTLGHAEAQ